MGLLDDHDRRTGDDRRTDPMVSRTLVIQLAVWLIAALVTYGAVNARVAVLESRVDGLKADVAEIKGDIKTLLSRH
jgi:hypothetical protein